MTTADVRVSADKKHYLVGIDVGSYSVGLSAVEVDEDRNPVGLLSAVSYIHDAGVDPTARKEAATRRAVSGVARRTRRLYRRKRKRLVNLDRFIEKCGWPVVDNEAFDDPLLPWRARMALAEGFIEDDKQRALYLSIAMRHIARHRGWRNPYTKVQSLHSPQEHSDAFKAIREDVEKELGRPLPENATVAQVIGQLMVAGRRLRGEGGVISARLQQVDHALEINTICAKQRIPDDLRNQLIDMVFAAESPKGAASGRVGKDPLSGRCRAGKASDAFQRYRIAALTANLRIRQGAEKRRLTQVEMALVNDLLVNAKGAKQPTWVDVAEVLGIDRGQLLGTATMLDDGERAGATPPVHATNLMMASVRIAPLKNWWLEADQPARDAMIKALSLAEADDFDSEEGAQVQALFSSLTDEEHEKLDGLHLPAGRAAYSEDTLRKLTEHILAHGSDLYEARRAVFGVSEDWAPPAPDIAEPTGNPAVDRVLKIVNRWLSAAEAEWGAPLSVNIEHGRDAFVSELKSREIDRDIQRRTRRNYDLLKTMQEELGIDSKPSRADLWRYQSVQRQNGQCAYCGSPITYSNCEMDHIVPRAGQGSTNKRENLVATCARCNRSKLNIPFAVWAERSTIPGVSVKEAIDRTKMWLPDSGMRAADFRSFVKQVQDRFRRTTLDEPIDNRSAESVSWMANELRARIAQHFSSGDDQADTKVRVFRGEITARARAASGIQRDLNMIGGKGKQRLDRRHHAVDASVIALMQATVAQVLVERNDLKHEQALRRQAPQWKEYEGADEGTRFQFRQWKRRMHSLLRILNQALDEDRIVVMSNLRLRLGNSQVHEAQIGKLAAKKVGDAFSVVEIDRASSEALWCALTRDPDYDPKEGLPENPERTLRVHGTHLSANDEVHIFPVGAAAIAIRGGYAELGASFHHARIYRINGKKPSYGMVRVYSVDLQKFRQQDLFSVELKPQTVSMRYADPKVRKAIAEGNAEYLGWLVSDDELLLDASSFTGQVADTQAALGPIKRWRLDGLFDPSKLRLRPLQLAAEGLASDSEDYLKKTLDRPGWRPAVNKLFSVSQVTVIRRDALGRPRLESGANLPVTKRF